MGGLFTRPAFSATGINSSFTRRTWQTAVYFDADDLELPQLYLQPEPKGAIGFVFDLLGGMGDIDFEDSPEFSGTYMLHAVNIQATRTLFTREVREVFAAYPGWHVGAKGNGVVFFWKETRVEPKRRKAFFEQALSMFEALRSGESALDARPDLHRDIRDEDYEDLADEVGGILGQGVRRAARKEIAQKAAGPGRVGVDPEELEALLAQRTPRILSDAVRGRVERSEPGLTIAGVLVLLIGWTFGGFMATTGAGALSSMLVLLFTSGMGGFILLLRFLSIRTPIVLLERGELVEGEVLDVRTVRSKQPRDPSYDVSVRYERNRLRRKASFQTNRTGADLALEARRAGVPIRLLVHPKYSWVASCPDLLTLPE